MIDEIIEICARNRLVVFILVCLALLSGFNAMQNIALDAIPDLSDTQVIIYSRWDRSPDIMEDQVTYPIVKSLLGVPRVRDIRGFSDFGYSFVYLIFEDGTDIYWARSRVVESLSNILPRLPSGVEVELAKDATAIGWIYQYALVDTSGTHDLSQLRSLQDWYLRYELQSVPGVAEVAPIGGFVRQYQVNLDPAALAAYGVPLEKVVEAVRRGNNDVEGRLIEFSGREYMVRGRGYLRSIADMENLPVGLNPQTGAAVFIKQLGKVEIGPDIRRGVGELHGQGETVGGIVIMRYGENALKVIARVQEKIAAISRSLPEGVRIVTTYDRSDLILRSIGTLRTTLTEELSSSVSSSSSSSGTSPAPSFPSSRFPSPSSSPSSLCTAWESRPTSCPSAALPSPSGPWWTPLSSSWSRPTRSWNIGALKGAGENSRRSLSPQ